MNIDTGPGIINVPGDVWDQVVEFYKEQLGPFTSNDDGAVAIWQQGNFELKLLKSAELDSTAARDVYVGVPYQPQGGLNLSVIPFYAGHQGSASPYTITLYDIQLTTKLSVQGNTVVKFGVIYNPPY